MYQAARRRKLKYMDLAALEAVKRLKYRYLRCVDTKNWDEMADVLAADATADYGTAASGGPVRLTGRDGILDFLRKRLGDGIITSHLAGQPEIDIHGTTATGAWCLQDTVIATEHRVVISGAAFYEDRYTLCDDGRWRIQHTGFRRTYEAMVSLDDLPSFQLMTKREPVR